ncbi:MAG: patatin-like phospholipase family protein [Candidatus Omnitrophica bacterium]|nr:patatin-like phospholipase family protein [Candidatus Omnitrophota bacterium]
MFDFLKSPRRKVTLVLGGGSARGVAHVGVLKVLEREKIPIDMIVGTSMGAMIGAAYSVGMPISVMEDHAYKFVTKRLLDPTMPKMGLLAGDKLEANIKALVDDKQFEDCRIPLAIVTNDIETGEEVIFRKGNLTKVVRASCSWPGIFNPVRIDGRLLCDGGIKHSVPTKIARSLGADYIIAVDVGFCVRKGKVDNIFQMIVQSFQIMGEELNHYQSRDADSIIKVFLPNIDQAAFEKGREIVAHGIEAAEAAVGRIKKDLKI